MKKEKTRQDLALYNKHIKTQYSDLKKVNVMKYFSVMANGKKWTKQEVTIDDLEARGFKVQPSRLYGDFDVFHGVQRVATLFKTQEEAMQYIA